MGCYSCNTSCGGILDTSTANITHLWPYLEDIKKLANSDVDFNGIVDALPSLLEYGNVPIVSATEPTQDQLRENLVWVDISTNPLTLKEWDVDTSSWVLHDIQGADGKSAYELWVDEGNTGTVEEFLNSLKGTIRLTEMDVTIFGNFNDTRWVTEKTTDMYITEGLGNQFSNVPDGLDLDAATTYTCTVLFTISGFNFSQRITFYDSVNPAWVNQGRDYIRSGRDLNEAIQSGWKTYVFKSEVNSSALATPNIAATSSVVIPAPDSSKETTLRQFQYTEAMPKHIVHEVNGISTIQEPANYSFKYTADATNSDNSISKGTLVDNPSATAIGLDVRSVQTGTGFLDNAYVAVPSNSINGVGINGVYFRGTFTGNVGNNDTSITYFGLNDRVDNYTGYLGIKQDTTGLYLMLQGTPILLGDTVEWVRDLTRPDTYLQVTMYIEGTGSDEYSVHYWVRNTSNAQVIYGQRDNVTLPPTGTGFKLFSAVFNNGKALSSILSVERMNLYLFNKSDTHASIVGWG